MRSLQSQAAQERGSQGPWLKWTRMAQRVKANVLFFDRTLVSESLWTKQLWNYDLRTSQHFTLKTNPLTWYDLDDIVACYHQDKVSLDLFWLKDESLEDSADLPDPDVIATDFSGILPTALEQFETIPNV